jgi:hypothetical protein
MSEGFEGYEKDKCWFCHGKNAGYQRGEDGNIKALHDACEKCARKPYPQPKQFQSQEAPCKTS